MNYRVASHSGFVPLDATSPSSADLNVQKICLTEDTVTLVSPDDPDNPIVYEGVPQVNEVLAYIRSHPMHCLKDLELTLPLHVIRTLFMEQMPPNLARLSFTSMDISPSLAVFQAPLTTLLLETCDIWQTYGDMLDTLEALPMLKSLVISSCKPVDRRPPLSDARPVLHMFHLQEFTFCDRWAGTVYILDRLSFPYDLRLKILLPTPDGYAVEGASVADPWDPLPERKKLNNGTLAMCRSVNFEVLTPPGPKFVAPSKRMIERGEGIIPDEQNPVYVDLLRSIEWSDGFGQARKDAAEVRIENIIPRVFHYGGAVDLHIQHANFGYPAIWADISKTAGYVKQIHVTGTYAAIGLLHALNSLDYPYVTGIWLEAVDMSKMVVASPMRSFCDVLRDLLFRRKHIGKEPLMVILITRCCVDAKRVELLQGEPHVIRWDQRNFDRRTCY